MTVTLLTASDALAGTVPIDWQIDGLLPVGSMALMFGQPGSKKTYSALDLAVCTALGTDWCGFHVKPGAVLVIDEESGPRRLLRRMGEVLRGHMADAGTPLFATSLESFNFWTHSGKNGAAELESQIRTTGARLVIIDALADVMLGGDENLVKDAQRVFHALRQVAERTGACIILIHHTIKNGNGYRGSSAILGALDLAIDVVSEPNETVIRFKTTKARDTEPQQWGAEAHWMPDSFWLTGATVSTSTAKRIYTKAERYVLEYLIAHGNTAALFDIMNNAAVCSPGTAKNAVYKLASEKMLYRSDSGNTGTPAIYTLEPAALVDNPL